MIRDRIEHAYQVLSNQDSRLAYDESIGVVGEASSEGTDNAMRSAEPVSRSAEIPPVLEAFEDRTGVPVLLNTSFNIKGEPIVCSPRDALRTFWSTGLDALVIGPFIIDKPESPS